MRLERRLSDFDRSRGRYYFRKISVVLLHVQFKAKRYFTSVQSEVKKTAADAVFAVFRTIIIQITQKGTFFPKLFLYTT